MSRKTIYSFVGLSILVLLTWVFSTSEEKNDDFSEVVKISLREIGNQLLLSNQDSTSLILPVLQIDNSKFEIIFQNHLSILPNDLVSFVKSSIEKSELSENYRVEVIQCQDNEVGYSYEMSKNIENTIIPCAGRILPINCYTIQIQFLDNTLNLLNKQAFLYILVFVIFLIVQFILYRRKSKIETSDKNEDYKSIGSFHFYPDQNKLVKAATEISLSKKECELLEIFISNPNQIIKREDLTKKVWEDNGVFVGRSLDTYISKLRKKLKEDKSIKLTNIHGVGYKLEL